MGIKIITDDFGVKVWRSDRFGFPQYSISISSKTESGERVNEYKPVRFRRGVELENGDEIYIESAFPTLDFWRDKTTNELKHKEIWMITDFSYRARYAHEDPQPQIFTQENLPDNVAVVDDIELPF